MITLIDKFNVLLEHCIRNCITEYANIPNTSKGLLCVYIMTQIEHQKPQYNNTLIKHDVQVSPLSFANQNILSSNCIAFTSWKQFNLLIITYDRTLYWELLF